MLWWFRKRGPYISTVVLATYAAGMLPLGTAWADTPPEMYEADSSSWAEGEYTEGSKVVLEDHLASQAPGGGAPSRGPSIGDSGSEPATALAQDGFQEGASISPQAISLPSGAATMAGMGESFTAQLTTGVAAFNVPLTLPAGRVGLSPSLSLVYASSSGYGLAGVGWSLAGPLAIARQSDRGIPRYDDRDD